MPSNVFLEAMDALRTPFKTAASSEPSAPTETKLVDDDYGRKDLVAIDGCPAHNTGNHANEDINEPDTVSSIAHLLDIGKFDMLDKPKTEKKWGKVSKAVQEKIITVAPVKLNCPVLTVDTSDLLLFYYSKHRTIVWLATHTHNSYMEEKLSCFLFESVAFCNIDMQARVRAGAGCTATYAISSKSGNQKQVERHPKMLQGNNGSTTVWVGRGHGGIVGPYSCSSKH